MQILSDTLRVQTLQARTLQIVNAAGGRRRHNRIGSLLEMVFCS